MPQRKIHIRKKFLTISGISVKKKYSFNNANAPQRLMHTKFAVRLTSFANLIFAFSSLSAAEYSYVGTESYYSLDDPNSWTPSSGAVKDTYSWMSGNVFVFDSGANPGAANQVAIKYFSEDDQPRVGEFVFKTSMILNGPSENASPSLAADKMTMYSGDGAARNYYLNRFQQVEIGSASIGASSSGPTSASTIFSMSFRNGAEAYYYNSASDNFLSADIGRMTLNGVIPSNPNDQNTAIWYVNNQSAYSQSTSAVIRVGGIDGSGIVRNNFANDVTGSTTLVFSNTSDAAFKGVIMDDWVDPAKFATLHIVMDGAADVTQTIRQVSGWTSGVWNRADLDSVGTTIKSGTLAISSAVNGSTFIESARVRIEGGSLAAALADAEGVGGTLRVRGIDWVGGKIKTAINRGQILSTNGISQLGGDGAKYVFEVDLSDFAPDTTFEGDEFSLLVSDSGSFGDISKYEAEFVYNGVEITNLEYEILSTAHGLNISLMGTIPEPAETAALAGLAAVLLSALRKRRR